MENKPTAPKPKRSAIYGSIADTLSETCIRSINADGRSILDRLHGSPSLGHVAYVSGELNRRRPEIDLTSIHDSNLVLVMRNMIETQLDLDNEIHRCFVGMGLGMLGPADDHHLVLGGVPARQRKLIHDGLIVTNEFDNNWEAFNGSILVGRHMLYDEAADTMLNHFEKIASKYDETGYFDDTRDLGNYNNYGFMSINYPLRAGEFLDAGHPVRRAIESRFKDHALRYVELVRSLVSPNGDTWPFGRSAGVLGQLQCVALIEQCLSKSWIDPKDVNQFRAIARLATKRMHDLYWDETQKWFSFRGDHHTAYDYRASLPMAWDMLRYFLQIEEYAARDEDLANGDQRGILEDDVAVHEGSLHREIVTNPKLKTAVYVWSDGNDHAVVPIMAGPHQVTGDTMARPYAQGLFEWTTQHRVPTLCPQITIDGENFWPAWHAARTELRGDGDTRIYTALFDPLYSDEGSPCPHAISCETRFLFSTGQFSRFDIWRVEQSVEVEGYALEVLQPQKHPQRPHSGDVHKLTVGWESEIEEIQLAEKSDVSDDPVYRNYHGHASHSWKINAARFRLEAGRYTTTLRLQW